MIKRMSGFTLIELLIVVAIIAILAAIAVPNFLEAQTRSKVSRVRSDHRALATALEAYYVDNNGYPVMDTSARSSARPGSGGQASNDWGFGANNFPTASAELKNMPTFRVKKNNSDNLMTLTTPVAYITSLFTDPFGDTKGAIFNYGVLPLDCFRSGWILWSFGPDSDEKTSGDIKFVRESGREGGIKLDETTYGCANLSQVPSPGLSSYTYDPTNGTTSNGDVWRVKQ